VGVSVETTNGVPVGVGPGSTPVAVGVDVGVDVLVAVGAVIAVAVGVAVAVAVGAVVAVAVGVAVAVAVGAVVGLSIAVGVAIAVRLGAVVGLSIAVAVPVAVGEGVSVGVAVGTASWTVSRRSSNSWSPVLDRRVRLVVGFIQPVVRVFGLLPEVVVATSGLPGLLRVNSLLPEELTLTLLTITGLGKVIVPCDPPFAMYTFQVGSPAQGIPSTTRSQVQPA